MKPSRRHMRNRSSIASSYASSIASNESEYNHYDPEAYKMNQLALLREKHRIFDPLLHRQNVRNSYTHLQNLNVNAVKRHIHDFASGMLPPANADSVTKAVQYISAAQFKNAIDAAVRWLKAQVGKHPYALIVEHSPTKLKSSAWLAHKVIDALGKPVAIVFDDNEYDLDRAFDEGARVFVHLDDAMYSGQQKMIIMLNFGNWQHYTGKRAKLLIAAGYSTDAGLNLVRKFSHEEQVDAEVYAAGSLDHISKKLKEKTIAKIQRRYRQAPAPTLALLAHKIPNHVSFGFGGLNAHLEKAMREPGTHKWVAPYKRLQIPILPNNVKYAHDSRGRMIKYIGKRTSPMYIAHTRQHGRWVRTPEKDVRRSSLYPPPPYNPRYNSNSNESSSSVYIPRSRPKSWFTSMLQTLQPKKTH